MKMNTRIRILHWFPRILSFLYILYVLILMIRISLGEGTTGQRLGNPVSFLISFVILLIILGIAWQRELLGGFLFLITGLFASFLHATLNPASAYFCLSCPLYLTGLLFIISDLIKNRQKRSVNGNS